MPRPTKLRASSTDRTYRCPGWPSAAATLPPREEEVSAASQSGTDVHEGIATAIEQECSAYDLGFDGREAFIVNEFTRKVNELAFERLDNHEYAIELYLEAPRYPWTGHTDFCAVGVHRETGRRIALVVDYKTGRAEQPPAWDHLQLRNYGVLWKKELAKTGVEFDDMELWLFSAGNPPETRFTFCTLDHDQLAQAEKDMRKIAAKSRKDDAKRKPGISQCKYCPCAGNPEACPESCMAIMRLTIPETSDIVSPADISDILVKWKQIKELGAKLEKWAKEKLEVDDKIIPGWTLKPGRTNKVIKDVTDGYFKLKPILDADPEVAANMYASCTSASFTKLKGMLHAKLKPDNPKFTKKAAERLIIETLGDTMTFTSTSPSLAATKEEK